MMPGVNFVIYGCSSARTTPEISLYRSLTLEENSWRIIIQDRAIDDNLKKQIKNRTCIPVDYTKILAIGQTYFSFYPPFFLNIHN